MLSGHRSAWRRRGNSRAARIAVPLAIPMALGLTLGIILAVSGGGNTSTIEQSALGGMSKLQWKVDWAMRWHALGVDYETCGKDLTDSLTQSARIVKVLGGRRPEGLIYELFLDEKGEKISKSKGNGLTIEEWLTYGTEESLGFYIYREPKSAKQLHAGVIPRAVDEYWQFRAKIPEQPLEQQLGNPAWHLLRANGYHGGDGDALPVTYGLLLNLAGVLGADAPSHGVRPGDGAGPGGPVAGPGPACAGRGQRLPA